MDMQRTTGVADSVEVLSGGLPAGYTVAIVERNGRDLTIIEVILRGATILDAEAALEKLDAHSNGREAIIFAPGCL